MQETPVRPLGGEHPLEEVMATHSSIPAWEFPWTEEPGRLQSMGWQRAGHQRSSWLTGAASSISKQLSSWAWAARAWNRETAPGPWAGDQCDPGRQRPGRCHCGLWGPVLWEPPLERSPWLAGAEQSRGPYSPAQASFNTAFSLLRGTVAVWAECWVTSSDKWGKNILATSAWQDKLSTNTPVSGEGASWAPAEHIKLSVRLAWTPLSALTGPRGPQLPMSWYLPGTRRDSASVTHSLVFTYSVVAKPPPQTSNLRWSYFSGQAETKQSLLWWRLYSIGRRQGHINSYRSYMSHGDKC